MPNLAIVGGQWGDEGKGKVVDLLAPHFRIVARYQGGPNAGHTVVCDAGTFALHHIPSGILHEGVLSAIGPGVLVDPETLLEEIRLLTERGVPVGERLRISTRAHLILPMHRELDAALESRSGNRAIGTTRRGIGPATSAKMHRWGVTFGDLARPEAVGERIARLLDEGHGAWLEQLGVEAPAPDAMARTAASWWERLAPLADDVGRTLRRAIREGAPVLFEGAQGTLLDIDHGTYPYVTSSSTTTAGVAAGLGVSPRSIDCAIGIFKAYATRVGSGPFPSEARDPAGDRLRAVGREFGTTTGRPRRCGWFDAVAARYAVELNGLDGLAMTKFDVLSGMEEIRLCVAYEIDGERVDDTFPATCDLERAEPVYETHPGFSADIAGVRRLEDLPREARAYLERIESLCGAPIALLSVGADRGASVIPESSVLVRQGLLAGRRAGG